MAAQEIILTPEGSAKLKEELEWRRGPEADRIKEAISEARGFGDLSENAEYDAARDEQARNQERIAEISGILANARVVDSTDTNEVSINTSVTVEQPGKDPIVFHIVGTTETNSLQHRISNESPVGAALYGHKVGDEVEVLTPRGGRLTYTITSITPTRIEDR